MEAIKTSEKINCSIGARHSERGIVNISLVGCKHQTIAGKICDQSKKCQGKFDCLVYEMLFIK